MREICKNILEEKCCKQIDKNSYNTSNVANYLIIAPTTH